jgi:hypothetical protein
MSMHHDNIGWVAPEGFHPEHFQTILFAPPGLPAGTHTHSLSLSLIQLCGSRENQWAL